MYDDDYMVYSGVKFFKFYENKNLSFAMECIAYKYGITTKIGNIEIPKNKKTKLFIIEKCFEYFLVRVSYKQIHYLLNPQKCKFPYTAIVFIETIYNLLKAEGKNKKWKEEMGKYLTLKGQKQVKYERFLLGDISENISRHKDDFMDSPYSKIYKCFVDSREKYERKFYDIPMVQQWKEDFPSEFFIETDVPKSIYTYQAERIYLEVR